MTRSSQTARTALAATTFALAIATPAVAMAVTDISGFFAKIDELAKQVQTGVTLTFATIAVIGGGVLVTMAVLTQDEHVRRQRWQQFWGLLALCIAFAVLPWLVPFLITQFG
jgi:uncharacterized membrane protein YidH (DUF202 family)